MLLASGQAARLGCSLTVKLLEDAIDGARAAAAAHADVELVGVSVGHCECGLRFVVCGLWFVSGK